MLVACALRHSWGQPICFGLAVFSNTVGGSAVTLPTVDEDGCCPGPFTWPTPSPCKDERTSLLPVIGISAPSVADFCNVRRSLIDSVGVVSDWEADWDLSFITALEEGKGDSFSRACGAALVLALGLLVTAGVR